MHVGAGASSKIVHPAWDITAAEMMWARLRRMTLERRSAAVISSCSQRHLAVARVCLEKAAEGYRKARHSSMNPYTWSRPDVASNASSSPSHAHEGQDAASKR